MGPTPGEADDELRAEAVRMTVREMKAVRGIGWDADLDALRDDVVEPIDPDDSHR